MTRAMTPVLPPLLDHERRVKEMMSGFGQSLPDRPGIPDDKIRILRVRLLLEEVLELAEASGVRVSIGTDWLARLDYDVTFADLEFAITGPADLPLVVDALSDISVVNTGAFISYGVCMAPMLELTDANNLMKIANGRLDEHGKFQKSPTHPAPNYTVALALQGWSPEPGPDSPLPEAPTARAPATLGPPSPALRAAATRLQDTIAQQLQAGTPAAAPVAADYAGLETRVAASLLPTAQEARDKGKANPRVRTGGMNCPPADPHATRDKNGLLPGEQLYYGGQVEEILRLLRAGEREQAVTRLMAAAWSADAPHSTADPIDPASLRPTDAYVRYQGPCVIYKRCPSMSSSTAASDPAPVT